MVVTSFIYGFWLHLFIIVWSRFLLFTVSDYTFSPLYGRYFFYLRSLITPFNHCMVGTSFIYGLWLHLLTTVWSVLLLFTVSDYTFWPLYAWYFFYLRFMITPFDHCMVGTSFIDGFWLHHLTIVWSVFLLFTVSDYTFWPLHGRYFFYLPFLITPFDHCMVGTSFI